MNNRYIVLAIAFVFSHHTFGTLIKINGATLPSSKNINFLKNITFFFDNHNENLTEQEQTQCIIKFLQANNTANTPFQIYIEQASKLFVASEFAILYKLHENIQKSYPPLNHVTIQNIEIRYPAIIACSLLLSDEPQAYMYQQNYTIDNYKKTIGSLLFQDILDELDIIKKLLATYYDNHENKKIIDIYTKHIYLSNQYYESFKQKLTQLNSHHKSILAYVLKTHENEEQIQNNNELAHWIKVIFSPLLELHILQNILETEHENILVIVGANHNPVLSMLYNLNATPMYNDLKTHDNKQPSTSFEITQGLQAQLKPLEPIEEYDAPTCYTPIKNILSYLTCAHNQ